MISSAATVYAAIGTFLGIVGFSKEKGTPIVGSVSFSRNDFPASFRAGTLIRVAAGLEPYEHQDKSYAGNVKVDVFNDVGDQLGIGSRYSHVHTGEVGQEIKFEHYHWMVGQQATYARLTGHNDGICIASMTVTWPDESSWVWLGDWGRICDRPWGYSNVYMGSTKDGVHVPYCMWLDKDESIKGTPKAFQLWLPHFAVHHEQAEGFDKGRICNTKSFKDSKIPDHGLVFVDAYEADEKPDLHGLKKRGIMARGSMANNSSTAQFTGRETTDTQNRNETSMAKSSPVERLYSRDDRIIISSKPFHRASELCESHNSLGPSLVSRAEKSYCDMKTKTLHRICDDSNSSDDGCFDMKTLSLANSAGIAGRIRARHQGQFSKVLDWDNNTSYTQKEYFKMF